MLSDVLREKTDKWIARKRKEGMDKARAEGVAEGRAESAVEARAEGRIEGRAENQAEVRKLLQEWNQRRLDSEARGEPFHEPPPFLD